jgi:hypothetical protein
VAVLARVVGPGLVAAVHGVGPNALELFVLLVARLALVLRVLLRVGGSAVARDAPEARRVAVVQTGVAAHVLVRLAVVRLTHIQIAEMLDLVHHAIHYDFSLGLLSIRNFELLNRAHLEGNSLVHLALELGIRACPDASADHTRRETLVHSCFATSSKLELTSLSTLLVLVIHRVDERGTRRVSAVQEVGLGLCAVLVQALHCRALLLVEEFQVAARLQCRLVEG